MSLTLKDKKYIDTAIATHFHDEAKPFFENLMQQNRDHMTALKEAFHDEVRGLAELIQERPTRNEVREMIHEEIEPIKIRLTKLEKI